MADIVTVLKNIFSNIPCNSSYNFVDIATFIEAWEMLQRIFQIHLGLFIVMKGYFVTVFNQVKHSTVLVKIKTQISYPMEKLLECKI